MEPRHFIQVVLGPRQVGKTTTIRQVLAALGKPSLYFSADDVRDAGPQWLSRCWETARIEASRNPDKEIILIIDEVQKVPNWSEVACFTNGRLERVSNGALRRNPHDSLELC